MEGISEPPMKKNDFIAKNWLRFNELPFLSKTMLVLLSFITCLGVYFRFYHITDNHFIYYDEGLYLLDTKIEFLRHIEKHPPQSFQKLLEYLKVTAVLSISQAKPIWFFLADLRAYLVGVEAWYFTRLLSAIFGTLTLPLVFLLGKNYYNSKWTGILACALLAVLPSHVFYSRLGMQEALSTFLFCAAFYFYLSTPKLHFKTFLSGFLFSCVFFTNYRMILSPFFIVFSELFISLTERRLPNFRKLVWNTLTFFFFIFMIGAIYNGANTNIAFAWMFYQAHLAKSKFDFINIFSFPYYIFRLESICFGLTLFANLYFIRKKQFKALFPFALVCLEMGLFTFAQEKGVRYLCVVMPFMAIASSAIIMYVFNMSTRRIFRYTFTLFLIILFSVHIYKSNKIIRFKTDHKNFMRDLGVLDPKARILSSQKLLQQIHADEDMDVFGVPHLTRFYLALHLQRGSKYLVLDPQIYISHTRNKKRFSLELDEYLSFVKKYVPPEKTYPHFNQDMLERFVLEHNENLRQSLAFLKANKNGELGRLYVYDIRKSIAMMNGEVGGKSRVTTQIQNLRKRIQGSGPQK